MSCVTEISDLRCQLVSALATIDQLREALATVTADRDRMRMLTEDRHAPNTLEWRTLVDELRQQVADAERQTREHAKRVANLQRENECEAFALGGCRQARDENSENLRRERDAHAETRKALEFETDCLAAEKKAHEHCWQRKVLHIEERDTARSELAKAEARVKELEAHLNLLPVQYRG